MVAPSDANNMFSVPSVLENTQSTVYRWASDSPPSLKHATELSTLSTLSEDDGTGPSEYNLLPKDASSDYVIDAVEHNHQLNHITHLAKLLDKFNQKHPSPESVRSLLVSPSRISTPLSDSLIYSSNGKNELKNRPVPKKVTESDTSLVSDTGSPREHVRHYSEGSARRPSELLNRPNEKVIARAGELAPTVFENGDVAKKSVPSSGTVSHRSEADSEKNISHQEKDNAYLVQDHSISSSTGDEDQLTRDDYIFLLRQLRGLSKECDNRGKIIEELQRGDPRQPAQQPAQQPLSHSMYVEPASPKQLNDLESHVAQPSQPVAQSSLNSHRPRRVILEDADVIASPTSQQEELSFHGIAELDQSRRERRNDALRYEDDHTTIRWPVNHIQQPVVMHPQPIRSNQSQIIDESSVRRLHSLPTSVAASYDDDRSSRRHEIGARNHEESRLLESLNDSLRHSLRLEQDLEQAKAEIAELRGSISELSRKDRDTSGQKHSQISNLAAFDISERRPSISSVGPAMSSLRAAEPSVPAISGIRRIPSTHKETISTVHGHANIRHSHNPKLYERASSTEVIEELERLLGEAEKEVAKLKGNAKILGPSAMPDARRVTALKHDKLYYKLQMDHVDSLGVSELGNLIKNILLQLSTPLSKLPERVMTLNAHIQSEERYMHFANDVHAALYRRVQMHPGPIGSQAELQCLGEMVGRVEKLARDAERRSTKGAIKY
ncbi:hypothetical protein V1508DRAFT_407964 [Lipomyces doorenjongii]|uniref:uncharacterized protein n=1 Tax=Lipomyces doorenjongii TaxID=383834 RepID=UPI0034CF91EE